MNISEKFHFIPLMASEEMNFANVFANLVFGGSDS